MSIEQISQEELRWRTLLGSDPQRVVELLRLGSDAPMTDNGDTGADHEPAIRAIMSLSNSLSRHIEREHWDRLVGAGLAEALCAIIADKSLLANEAKVRVSHIQLGFIAYNLRRLEVEMLPHGHLLQLRSSDGP